MHQTPQPLAGSLAVLSIFLCVFCGGTSLTWYAWFCRPAWLQSGALGVLFSWPYLTPALLPLFLGICWRVRGAVGARSNHFCFCVFVVWRGASKASGTRLAAHVPGVLLLPCGPAALLHLWWLHQAWQGYFWSIGVTAWGEGGGNRCRWWRGEVGIGRWYWC